MYRDTSNALKLDGRCASPPNSRPPDGVVEGVTVVESD
jgi:hypothetical protein